MSAEIPVITCVQVVYPNGEHVYEPLVDYVRNPAPGTYRLTENRKCAPEYIIGIDRAAPQKSPIEEAYELEMQRERDSLADTLRRHGVWRR